ncbi:MAG: hypothetical protein V8Q91_00180 [Bilophila wadsworthia]|uniref:hypothetical protein n=1 Tax=Bilophila wadsworthia TaxID=35833 RepID=UPI00300F6561
MRILFLHHTFPGPFRQLAARLGGLPGNEIVFLSERSRRDVWIPGVRNLTVSGVQPVMAKDRAERELLQMMRYGSRFANALLKLQQGGFEPDIVYAHPRWGCSFFAQDIFPQAFHAVYAEWYYTKGANYTFFTQGAARPAVEFAQSRVRNLCQLNALCPFPPGFFESMSCGCLFGELGYGAGQGSGEARRDQWLPVRIFKGFRISLPSLTAELGPLGGDGPRARRRAPASDRL